MSMRDVPVISSRSRFVVNTVRTQTGSSTPSSTNRRNSRLSSICCISSRVVPKGRFRTVPDREQRSEKAGSDQPLRRDGEPAEVGIKRIEIGIAARQRIVRTR